MTINEQAARGNTLGRIFSRAQVFSVRYLVSRIELPSLLGYKNQLGGGLEISLVHQQQHK